MILEVGDIGIFSDMEGMNAIVPALIAAIIVDPAPGNDGDRCTVGDKKVVVDDILDPRFRENHRNMDLLTVGRSVNKDVDAGAIAFFDDTDMLAVAVQYSGSV